MTTNKPEVKRYTPAYSVDSVMRGHLFMEECERGAWVSMDAYEALQAECEALRNGLKNARYRIEQGRIWNGMGWSLTGLHAYQQQRALDEIDAAMQSDRST